mmetsp:Transcript_41666/g.66061  ORF Transcript_41666/g.66061 Transcript_41666/m.66061 type:complete len:662 (-) Transcript_41666:85-2070(-)
MRYIVGIVFFLPSLLTPVRASQASSHAVLAAETERYQEYVVDEHGKTSPSSMMRREAFERQAPRRFMPRPRLKSLLQKRQERMLRRREKLWDLEKELESVHTKSKSYKPKCVVLHGKRLKATPGTGHGFGAPYNANIEKCTEACVARVNLAKDGGTRSSGAKTMQLLPKNALDGDGETVFVSKQQNEPWWQVDLGTDRKVGEVWISAHNCVGCEVGLRDEPCKNPTQTQTNNNGNSNDDNGNNEDNGNNDEDQTGELAQRTSVGDLENNGEMALLEKLANQIRGHESNETCNLGKTCGTLDENSNFVNCDGNTGQFLVIRHKGHKRLVIAEVEVWEDAMLSRKDAVAKMMPEAEDADEKAAMVLDGRADTTAISQAGDNPWLQIKLAHDANSVGKISIYPGTDRSKFLPTKEKPMMVGVSTKECTEEGCSKAGGFCGKLTAAKLAGPYIVDCGGKNGNFVWIEFPGKGRSINIATVEVEKSAQCEQVVLEKKDGKLTCISYKKYSGEVEEPEEGVDYTSAICHPAGKVGPAGVVGQKGDKGKQGPAGPKGAAGAKGDEGEAGATGEQGDVGAEGPEGLEADVAGLATMGQLNLAGVMCVAVTVAVMVILMQKVSPAGRGGGGAASEKTEGVEGEEAFEETFEEGGEALPEEAEAEEGEQVA